MAAGTKAVETAALTKRYGDRLALDALTLEVPSGEVFALLGPNGGGKTTLFRILATSLEPDEGRFLVDGLDPARDRRAVRRRLGVVFQTPGLDRKLTVSENLALHASLHGMPRATAEPAARDLLARFGLEERRRDRVETLSGGLARRVEIAKALLPSPAVLLLDEPSTGLDPGARLALRDTLRDLARRDGTTVLLTTHLFEEADAADRIGLLDRGRLVALGAPAALKAEVGGDVLTVDAGDADAAGRLAAEILGRFEGFAAPPAAAGAEVVLSRRDAAAFVPRLVEAFPGRFRSLRFGAPTLEDVFVSRTGRPFRDGAAA